MNVFNMFWSFISLGIGIILAATDYWILWPMTQLFASIGSSTTTLIMYIAQLGIITSVILFIFVFPIAIALDDEGKIIKNLGLSE